VEASHIEESTSDIQKNAEAIIEEGELDDIDKRPAVEQKRTYLRGRNWFLPFWHGLQPNSWAVLEGTCSHQHFLSLLRNSMASIN
jgi:hypothetical protein